MLFGIQYQETLHMEAIVDGGFSYTEIPYEIIESGGLQTYKKNTDGNLNLQMSGLICKLQGLTSNKLSQILKDQAYWKRLLKIMSKCLWIVKYKFLSKMVAREMI